jgi:hypothetical protein
MQRSKRWPPSLPLRATEVNSRLPGSEGSAGDLSKANPGMDDLRCRQVLYFLSYGRVILTNSGSRGCRRLPVWFVFG